MNRPSNIIAFLLRKVARFAPGGLRVFSLRIATKLVLSFLLIILLTSGIFSIVGVRVIGDRVVAEAQAKVQTDLNAAREIYLNKLASVNDVVRFTADRVLLMNALLSGDTKQAAEALGRTREREKLDVLTITDKRGRVLLRTGNAEPGGRRPVERRTGAGGHGAQGTGGGGRALCPPRTCGGNRRRWRSRRYFKFIDTPKARARAGERRRRRA